MARRAHRIRRLRRGRTLTLREIRRQVRQDHSTPPTPGSDRRRPHTRGECRDGPRPCPWIGCRYHLYLDVHPHTGSIRLNYPDLEVWQLEESCALDVAEAGAVTLARVGELLDLTRERIRQLEQAALARLEAAWRRERAEPPFGEREPGDATAR